VFSARGNNERLSASYDATLFIDPYLGFVLDDRKHFLNGMLMRRNASGGRYPLLENAKLRGTVKRRNMQPGCSPQGHSSSG
jgi:hypothetical protein